jgi:hypothetical protein
VRQATPHCDARISLVASIHSVLFLIDPSSGTGAPLISIRIGWNSGHAALASVHAGHPGSRWLPSNPSASARPAPPCAGDSGDRPDVPGDEWRPLLPTTAPVATATIGSVVSFFSDAGATSRSDKGDQRRGEAL